MEKESKIALLMMENKDGIGVQVFKNPEKAKEMFGELTMMEDARATLVCLDYDSGTSEMIERKFPDLGKSHSAFEIGVGPIDESEEDSE